MKRLLYPLSLSVICASLLSACDLLESHPYDVDVKYKNINRDNIALIEEKCAGKDTIRYVWMGDTQKMVR